MKYRIMYCPKCGKEYENVLSYYDEKCEECKIKLKKAWKIIEKDYSCVKIEN